MNKDNDIVDNKVECGGGFFDWSGDDNGGVDVYYTFKGSICKQLKGGVNNALYGKVVNLSEMYGEMVDDIIQMISGGKFYDSDEYLDDNGHQSFSKNVNKYTIAKYGISLEWMDRVINKRVGVFDMDRVYWCMIDRVGGVGNIDWMSIYNNNGCFITHNDDILVYIANEIIKGDIYRYFVDRYKLRIAGVDTSTSRKDQYRRKKIILEWDGGKRLISLGSLPQGKRDWWQTMTGEDSKWRVNISDYDVLLNGRREDEVLPDVCPIDNNIVLNYTRIDFSVNNDNNLSECKNHNDPGDDCDKIWSFASIDRINSNKAYDYDNVEVISYYYNAQVKNCASVGQTTKLYHYQMKRLLSKTINDDTIKGIPTKDLLPLLDMHSIYFDFYQVIHDNCDVILREIDRRRKKKRDKA